MTKPQETREVDIAEFCAGAQEMVRFVERGGTVTLLRDGLSVAMLLGSSHAETPVVQEVAPAYTASPPHRAIDRVPAPALLRLLGGTALRSVLAVFLREPEREVHQREIARCAGVGLRSAQIALDRLESLGLLESRRDGNRLYYRAARDERFEQLRQLLAREIGIPEVLARHLSSLSRQIRWAFVYGSVAAGTDRVDSDIDVIIVGDLDDDALAEPVAAAQRELGREIDVIVYRPEEYASRRASGNHFLLATLEGPRIDLIGGRDDA